MVVYISHGMTFGLGSLLGYESAPTFYAPEVKVRAVAAHAAEPKQLKTASGAAASG